MVSRLPGHRVVTGRCGLTPPNRTLPSLIAAKTNRPPFKDTGGLPFLEVHHVRHLAEQGSDRTSNAVALCPNCHRRCHLSADKDAFVVSLYENVPRLIAEPLSSAEPALTEAINVFIEP
ncbi:MAG: HNH endonuclease [Luteimonas sp.]